MVTKNMLPNSSPSSVLHHAEVQIDGQSRLSSDFIELHSLINVPVRKTTTPPPSKAMI